MTRKLTLFTACFIFAVIALAAGCNSHENKSADAHTAHSPEPRAAAAAFRAELATAPATIKAGEPTTLSFTVKDAQGAMAREMQIVHEKPMHLLIVSGDLAEFSHIHPTPQPDGTLKVTHTFPNGGDYKLYADFTPVNSSQVVEQIAVKVNGGERAKQMLVPDTVMTKSVDGISVTLAPEQTIKAGEAVMLNFKVADAKTGKPAMDLQKYLGEYAHFVIINEDLHDFLHAHPMTREEHRAGDGHGDQGSHGDHSDHGAMAKEHKDKPGAKPHSHSSAQSPTQASPSEVAAHTTFPKAGLYKIWAQFQRADKVITVPFVVRVAEGKAIAAGG
jgi:hypothetical protein